MNSVFSVMLLICFFSVCFGGELIRNASFEAGLAPWNVESEADIITDGTYGKIPDGRNMLHFRKAVWQNTGFSPQEKSEYLISFHAASWGTTRLTVELRLAKERNSPGELLESFSIAVPLDQVWAFRKDIAPEKRKTMFKQIKWFCPQLPKEIKSGYLVLRIRTHEGYAGIDKVSLKKLENPVCRIKLKGSLKDCMRDLPRGSRWLGSNNIGIAWKGNRPYSLAFTADGKNAYLKKWESGKLFEIRFIDSPVKSLSNLDYGSPEITSDDDTYVLKWKGVKKCPVDLELKLVFRDAGNEIGIGFQIVNRSDSRIVSLALPCGWKEQERDRAEFILPAWVGTGIPLKGMKAVNVISPGQLHSQWFGMQDVRGASWMLYCNDTGYNLKGLNIKKNGLSADFFWTHELWLKPHCRYRSNYETIIKFWDDADWNTMSKVYRDWAVKQEWYKTFEEKRKERPFIDNLKQGWSWLRGMPPVKEVGGRKCDTTYSQALECMAGFRKKIGIDPLFWYTGWYGPFDSKYPEFFPVAEEMGGDFLDFAHKVRSCNHFVSLHTNSAEWNAAASCFDKKLMAVWRGKYYESRYGDSHSNFVASLPLAAEKWLAEYGKIVQAGIPGIYYDVLGHVIAHDDNPRAGYREDEIGRSNWTKSKLKLWAAYRRAMPRTFFQTEANWEGSIPYLDANSGGATGWMFQDGRRPLPLWQLTYGDTGFFMMLYDGMGQMNAPAGFAVTPLYGAIQQYPQNLWKTMEPFWLHQVERQLLCGGSFAAAEMLSYHEYLKWRVSRWKDGIVIVNDGELRNGEFHSPIGKIRVEEMRGKANGAVCIVTKSGISSDGAKQILLNGVPLWKSTSNAIALTVNDRGIALYNPTKEEIAATISVSDFQDYGVKVPAGQIMYLKK